MIKQKGFFHIKYIADKAWGLVRDQIVASKHKKVADFWQPKIEAYFSGSIKLNSLKPKKELGQKIIWQYWGQESEGKLLPAVVQRCFNSIDKYRGDYKVIRLNDKNIAEYLDFPEFIYSQQGDLKFSRVFFSDLLRLSLLHVYGGVWLDATILLTAPLPVEFTEQDYFVFQRSDQETDKTFWAGPHTSYWSWNPKYRVKMLNSIIFAKKGSLMISTMLDLILHYWETQTKVNNYFFFQILYHELVNGKLKDNQCIIVSDALPHILRVLVDGTAYMPLAQLLAKVSMHKLTYFEGEKLKKLDDLLIQKELLSQKT